VGQILHFGINPAVHNDRLGLLGFRLSFLRIYFNFIMIVHEEFYLEDVPHSEAWSFFSDIPCPLEALPGLVELRQYAKNKYRGGVKVHIGPFNFTFRGNIEITLVDHTHFKVNIRGFATDNLLRSSFEAHAYTHTLPFGENGTQVKLEVHTNLTGILAKFGEFMLKPKAKQVVGYYQQAVKKEVLKRREQNLSPLTSHSERTPACDNEESNQ
jgi:carbon monoxide dehydrogenase subunit G